MKTKKDNNKISIRDCQKSDLDFVYDLMKLNMKDYVQKYWGAWDEEKFKNGLKQGRISVISYEEERIGFFDISLNLKKTYIHNLQIINSYQGQGIGKMAMNIIEEIARSNNSETIEARVFKSNPAVNFYKKIKYKVINEDDSTFTISKDL